MFDTSELRKLCKALAEDAEEHEDFIGPVAVGVDLDVAGVLAVSAVVAEHVGLYDSTPG